MHRSNKNWEFTLCKKLKDLLQKKNSKKECIVFANHCIILYECIESTDFSNLHSHKPFQPTAKEPAPGDRNYSLTGQG